MNNKSIMQPDKVKQARNKFPNLNVTSGRVLPPIEEVFKGPNPQQISQSSSNLSQRIFSLGKKVYNLDAALPPWQRKLVDDLVLQRTVEEALQKREEQAKKLLCIRTSEAIDYFSEIKRDSRLKASTEQTNLKRLKPFVAKFEFLPLDGDTIREQFLSYYAKLTPRYHRNVYDVLVDFYKTIMPKYHLPCNPMDEILRPKLNGSERPLHPLKSEWLPELFRAAENENEILVLQIELGAGWRPSEFMAIEAIDVRQALYNDNPLILVHGKERHELTPLLPETLELLSQHTPSNLGDHERIIRSKRVLGGVPQPMGFKAHTTMIYTLYQRARIPAGLSSGFIPYDLRDTFGSLVLRWSSDYWLTERLMRHNLPGEGKKYFQYPLDQLCEYIKQLSPVRRIQGANLKPPFQGRTGGLILNSNGEGGTRTPMHCCTRS